MIFRSEYLPFQADQTLIRRLDGIAPRYTLYPAADHFVAAFGPDDYRSWACKRNVGGISRALSLYVHLAFREKACPCCADSERATSDWTKGEQYLGYLAREVALQAPLFRRDPVVWQMHWGRSTATFFSATQLRGLFDVLRRYFAFAKDGEYSIEIDAHSADENAVMTLREAGFNRLNLRVPDSEPMACRLGNRVQSEEWLYAAVAAARRAGFQSVNIDLAYGLPWRNLFGLNRGLARVITAAPDRIALRRCAHLPGRFAMRRHINKGDLPTGQFEWQLLARASQRLTGAGYTHIGVDHFAKPDDELTVAQRQGRLHRNFKGYSTQPACDMVGFGVSAIGSIGPTCSQNHRDLARYYSSLDRRTLPILRGKELTLDDLVRRAVIRGLLCHLAVSKEAIEIAYLIDFDHYFAAELVELGELARYGLLELHPRWISVAPECRLLTHNVCTVFDKYLRRRVECPHL